MSAENPFSHPAVEFSASPEKTLERRILEHIESIPRRARMDVDALMGALSKRPDGMLSPEQERDTRAELREMMATHGTATVWDAHIIGNTHFEEIITSAEYSDNYPTERAQYDHANTIAKAEAGTLDRAIFSFGLTEPSYHAALKDSFIPLSQKPELNTLLLGAMARQSANEFGEFSRSLNPHAHAVAIDIEDAELKEANQNLVEGLRGDATAMDFPDASQDIVFTNFLTPFLRENAVPTGKKNLAMLQEAYRVLREGGRMVLAEKSPSFTQSNSHSWVAKLLLEESMAEIGFSMRPAQPFTRYTNHKEKMLGLELGNIKEDVYQEGTKTTKTFSYVVSGDK
ncbi:hypothetical protein BH11PAT4_BH11PAT4_6310 [soil metagenome]